MFAIGASEPLLSTSVALVRHSIVWIGDRSGETNLGLPSSHPICKVLLDILGRANFLGTWLLCREPSSMRDFERKSLLLRLRRASWTVENDHSRFVRAEKNVRAESPWPYDSQPALPWPQGEILVVGCLVGYRALNCNDEERWRSRYAIRGEGLILESELAKTLVTRSGHAISIGRTQTNNAPGLSIIGPEGRFDPVQYVEIENVVGLHEGADAARAWSYG